MMRLREVMILSLSFIALPASGYALPGSIMVDRPGELLDLAEQLTVNIQQAEKVRDKTLAEIKKRAIKLESVNKRLKSIGLSKAQRLELQAQKNRLEREENLYRRQALAVVKEQMDNVFNSLGQMRIKLEDFKDQETAVDPEVVQTFNTYFRISAELIKNSTTGVKGVSPGTLAMLQILESSLVISQKSTDFLVKAIDRIKDYQKVVSLYNAQLIYLAKALEKYGNVLINERDAITITVSLETASRFMEDLNIEKMEQAISQDFDRDPLDYLSDKERERYKRRVLKGGRVEGILKRYSTGHTLTNK